MLKFESSSYQVIYMQQHEYCFPYRFDLFDHCDNKIQTKINFRIKLLLIILILKHLLIVNTLITFDNYISKLNDHNKMTRM